MQYKDVQNIAKMTIQFIKENIQPGMTLIEIRDLCETKMIELGADSFWYWDVGAFVFAGDKTTVSVSGREYKTDDHIIEPNDIITIDLSPQSNCIWGDYARTLIVENGKIVKDVEQIQNDEWRNGLKMEVYLHEAMLGFVNENTNFEALFYYINDQIKARGYVNLDFLGNLGHSIVKDKKHRIYIEKGNTEKLSAVEAFTFEPHISLPGSLYGYKKENIYGFNGGVLTEL
mgnify:FL=1